MIRENKAKSNIQASILQFKTVPKKNSIDIYEF